MIRRTLAVVAVAALTACKGADGATGPAGPQGSPGTPGPAGAAGAAWYNGANPPANSLGANGDYYLQTLTGYVFRKDSGTWAQVGNLMGATGPAGPQGTQGPPGAPGTQGTSGTGGTGATRLTLTGTVPAGGSVVRALPAGTTFTLPPLVACYLAPSTSSVWVNVSDVATSTNAYACGITQSATSGLSVVMLTPAGTAGDQYAIVIVY